MGRYAVVDQNNIVQNVVTWDGLTQWAPPPGMTAVAVADGVAVDVGYTFTAPSTFTFGQTATQVAGTNRATLLQQGIAALASNITYLNIVSPTTAQAIAQVAALTKQVDALMRLAANQLDTTTGT